MVFFLKDCSICVPVCPAHRPGPSLCHSSAPKVPYLGTLLTLPRYFLKEFTLILACFYRILRYFAYFTYLLLLI